jgi:hypothetical protein
MVKNMTKRPLLALLLAAPLATLADGPTGVRIASVEYGGTGCPQGSVASTIAPDATQFTMIFDSFIASDGPGANPSDNRKDCVIHLKMEVPDGWAYQIEAVDFRGYASFDSDKSKGHIVSRFKFVNGPRVARNRVDFKGPFDDDYLHRVTVRREERAWSSCRGRFRDMDLDNEIVAKARQNGNAMLTVDSIDGTVKQTYQLKWARCEELPRRANNR